MKRPTAISWCGCTLLTAIVLVNPLVTRAGEPLSDHFLNAAPSVNSAPTAAIQSHGSPAEEQEWQKDAGTPATAVIESYDSLPAIACRFAPSVAGTPTQQEVQGWYFWREPTQVETRATTGETSEIWRRSQEGDIFYQLIFHKDKLVIDYTPAELQAAQRYPDWSDLASVIDPDFLKAHLKEVGKADTLGREARRYEGQVNGIALEVWWLEAEQVPALLRQVYSDHEVTLHLQEIYPLDESPWPRSQIEQYARRGFADLDDTESPLFAPSFQEESTFSYAR